MARTKAAFGVLRQIEGVAVRTDLQANESKAIPVIKCMREAPESQVSQLISECRLQAQQPLSCLHLSQISRMLNQCMYVPLQSKALLPCEERVCVSAFKD